MLFNKHDVEQHADGIAAYLPSGELFKSARISNSNFRKLLLGVAQEFVNAESYLITASEEYDIRTTSLFIEEWESALGIPDDIFTTDVTIEERRVQVLIKLMARGAQTVEDFIQLANVLGFDISITPGIEIIEFPLVFPIPMIETLVHARFIMYIQDNRSTLPLTLPFTIGAIPMTKLIQFLNKIKPANVKIITDFEVAAFPFTFTYTFF